MPTVKLPAHLTSAGAAVAERAAQEQRMTGVTLRAMRVFLIQVQKDALAETDSLTAGAPLLRVARVGFKVSHVLSGWNVVVDAVLGQMASTLHVPYTKGQPPEKDASPALTSARKRITASEIPGQVFSSVSVQISMFTSGGLSRPAFVSRLKKSLHLDAKAQTPPKPGPDADPKVTGTEGDSWDAHARRLARNEATTTYNSDVLQRLSGEGFQRKRWIAHHDRRTRPTHLEADGQVTALDSPFGVGGSSLMYPGDPNGALQETEGCRCVITGQGRHEAVPGATLG